MNHAHHEHAAHAHHHAHGHAHGPAGRHGDARGRGQPRDAAFSLLRASALERFAIAGAAIAIVWAGVIWAMS